MAINVNPKGRYGNPDMEATLHHKDDSIDDKHGVYWLAENPNVYEIQRDNNFEFIVTDIDGLLKAGEAPGPSSNYIEGAQQILRLSVNGAFVPHFTQQAIEVSRGNNTFKFAGVPKFSNGTIHLVDYVGANTKEAIMAWQNKSYDIRTEKVGLVTDYKKTCYLEEYTPDYQLVRSWKLHGCWVSGISEGEYSHESNQKKAIDVTIEYDWAEIDRDTETVTQFSGGGVGNTKYVAAR